ncbi:MULTISPECIES: hypothetical protein [Haloferax]|uniref:Uncharacterized protein n=1 Tax=Haloferax marinisediminis TaxID=2666142 RepID=A0A6G1Z0J1_9EURY|nr:MULTISPECIES: hypothetical protein [Haloferax]MRW80033.1 hypothetical protein [Haloferax marinisediminis]
MGRRVVLGLAATAVEDGIVGTHHEDLPARATSTHDPVAVSPHADRQTA